MRRCLPGDLIEAATLIAASETCDKSAICATLIDQADAAHRYAKRFGRAHPLWGNGSLMARALAETANRRVAQNSEGFLSALALVAHTLSQRKRARAC